MDNVGLRSPVEIMLTEAQMAQCVERAAPETLSSPSDREITPRTMMELERGELAVAIYVGATCQRFG